MTKVDWDGGIALITAAVDQQKKAAALVNNEEAAEKGTQGLMQIAAALQHGKKLEEENARLKAEAASVRNVALEEAAGLFDKRLTAAMLREDGEALAEIASGPGVYGTRAREYKEIALTKVDWDLLISASRAMLRLDTAYALERGKALEEETARLRDALTNARPLVEKWCHYQGDHKALFEQYLGPIDRALKTEEK